MDKWLVAINQRFLGDLYFDMQAQGYGKTFTLYHLLEKLSLIENSMKMGQIPHCEQFWHYVAIHVQR